MQKLKDTILNKLKDGCDKKKAPGQIRTGVGGFKVLRDNHYTTGAYVLIIINFFWEGYFERDMVSTQTIKGTRENKDSSTLLRFC